MRDRWLSGDEWWRPLPPGVSADVLRVLAARGVRAFGDGFVALLLPIYLVERSFSAFAIGAIVCGTLVGTALLTLWVGLIANRHSLRRLLLAASLLMATTGAGFATTTAFWPLLVIAFVGTMNPTSGDASIFVPLEQTVLTETIEPRRRTALFARYSVIGSCAAALGVLAAAFPDYATAWTGCSRSTAMQLMFGLYAFLGLGAFLLYRPLSPAVEVADRTPEAPLGPSKKLVYGMAALFGMDSFGTGFLVQSLLALWLYQAFQVSVTTTATILFWTGVCSAVSYLVAVPIAERIGLINTMVFTHLPSNILLILTPLAPNLATAIALLLVRSALSQMDGRVEDGRGSWGPMAITPFPISAHRTGGPDFRSPALRLASPQGTRRGSEWQAFEAQQTEFPIDSVVREPAGAAPCHFVPSCEEVAHALVGIAVNTAEC